MPLTDKPAGDECDLARLRRDLAEAERRLRRLQSDFQHRVRNLLAVILAITNRTAETSSGVEQYALHLDGRIGALARAQSMAFRDPAGAVELHQLIAEELLAHAALEGRQLSLSGPSVRLTGRAVETVWLAFHELAVNSIKYGALTTEQGRVAVAWTVERAGPAQLHLCWTEQDGPPPAEDRRAGFGTEVIERMLAYQLGGAGSLDVLPEGVACTMTLPISNDVRVESPV